MSSNFLEAFDAQTAALLALGDKIDSLAAATRAQDLCCGGLGDLPYYPPGYDPTTNPATGPFCDRAHSFAENWRQAAREIMSKAIAGDELGLGLLTLVVALLALPIAVLVALVSLISIFIIEISEEALYGAIDDLYYDIVCAIIQAENSAEAKAGIDAAIDAANGIVGFGVIATKIFKGLVGVEALNQIFLETYPILASKSGSDCSGCGSFECNCPPSGYGELGTGSKLANGLERTWYGAASGADSQIALDLPCNRDFEITGLRNCVDCGGGFPVFRWMRLSPGCVWPGSWYGTLVYCNQIVGTVDCGARIVVDSQGTAATPVEIDLIIYPGVGC